MEETRVNPDSLRMRNIYLAVGTVGLLFAGILYAWSILKVPLSSEFGWTNSQLATSYTITISLFCLGCIAGGDAVSGAATVILAMGAGKAAAKGIDEYLSGKN